MPTPQIVAEDQSPQRQRFLGPRVPPNLVQVRLIPIYRRLSFTPGFWSFSFSYAAAVSDALVWLAITKPPAATGYAIAVIALLTAFVSWIAYRTVLLAVRGQLLRHGLMCRHALLTGRA